MVSASVEILLSKLYGRSESLETVVYNPKGNIVSVVNYIVQIRNAVESLKKEKKLLIRNENQTFQSKHN